MELAVGYAFVSVLLVERITYGPTSVLDYDRGFRWWCCHYSVALSLD